MNKKVKIIIGATVFVSIVIALGYAEKFIYSDDSPKGNKKPNHFVYLSNKIDTCWVRQSQWNGKLYDSLATVVTSAQKFGNIKKKDMNLLLNKNSGKAIELILKYYDSEMQKPACNSRAIDNNQIGVNVIRQNLGGKNEKIAQADKMYNAYTTTIEFAQKSFTKNAELDGYSWEKYDRSIYDRQKTAISGNSYFNSHFKNITAVKNAWDSYENTIKSAQNNYYQSIASQLKNKFSAEEHNQYAQYSDVSKATDGLIHEAQERLNYADTGMEGTAKDELLAKLNMNRKELEDLKNAIDGSAKQWAAVQGKFLDETVSFSNSGELQLTAINNYITSGARNLKRNVDALIDKTNETINKVAAL